MQKKGETQEAFWKIYHSLHMISSSEYIQLWLCIWQNSKMKCDFHFPHHLYIFIISCDTYQQHLFASHTHFIPHKVYYYVGKEFICHTNFMCSCVYWETHCGSVDCKGFINNAFRKGWYVDEICMFVFASYSCFLLKNVYYEKAWNE